MKPLFFVTILFIIGGAVGAPYDRPVANGTDMLDYHILLEILGGHSYEIGNTTTASDTVGLEGGQLDKSALCYACLACLFDVFAPACWPILAGCGGAFCDCCHE
ncbi:hypothetical protein FOZ60_008146 [Perkinsus olseni]|uniref:Uncharacterized protein n=1 Tax=Perkinsus olseni TaxID=32597 RepID=A0A7J6NJV8_PEROL|nr:hypothetical protein FOZ60_008146 [Perkinsus olseni]